MDTTTANMWTGVKIVPERQLRPMPAHLTATLGAAPGVGAALPPLPPSAGRRRKWQPPKPAQAPKFDAGPTAESSAELLFGHYWPESKDAFQATLDGGKSPWEAEKAALQGTIDEAEAKEQNAQEPGSPVMEQPSSPEPGEEQRPPRRMQAPWRRKSDRRRQSEKKSLRRHWGGGVGSPSMAKGHLAPLALRSTSHGPQAEATQTRSASESSARSDQLDAVDRWLNKTATLPEAWHAASHTLKHESIAYPGGLGYPLHDPHRGVTGSMQDGLGRASNLGGGKIGDLRTSSAVGGNFSLQNC